MGGQVSPSIAIAIPHAAHKPGRKESLSKLLEHLPDGQCRMLVLSDPLPHWEWSKRLWRWGLESGADYLVQLQDDVIVPENFIAAVKALLTSNPNDVTALMGIHPLAREVARMGGKMHRTRAWLLGNAYALSHRFLAQFVPWVEAHESEARVFSEDAFINRYCVDTARDVWHCVPSLADHDTSVPSTWGADSNGHRRATVSWKEYMPKEIEDPAFWVHSGEVRLFTDNLRPRCWCCLNEDAFISFQETGVHLGPNCVARAVADATQRMTRGPA